MSQLCAAMLGPKVKQTKVISPHGPLQGLRVDEKLYQVQTWLEIAYKEKNWLEGYEELPKDSSLEWKMSSCVLTDVEHTF